MIQLVNYDGSLPLDIGTHNGTKRMKVYKTGITVNSQTLPAIDAKLST